MWTWTYEAHEFTHDDEGDQVIALFSLSLSPEREEQKKRNSFYEVVFFSPTNGTFLSGVFSTSVTFVYGDLSRVRGIQSKEIFTSTNRC